MISSSGNFQRWTTAWSSLLYRHSIREHCTSHAKTNSRGARQGCCCGCQAYSYCGMLTRSYRRYCSTSRRVSPGSTPFGHCPQETACFRGLRCAVGTPVSTLAEGADASAPSETSRFPAGFGEGSWPMPTIVPVNWKFTCTLGNIVSYGFTYWPRRERSQRNVPVSSLPPYLLNKYSKYDVSCLNLLK